MSTEAEHWYELGNTRQKEGRLPEAAACFREAIRLRPDHAQAHNNLAVALLGGDCRLHEGLQEAARHFRTAIACGYAEAAENLAEVEARLGKQTHIVDSFHELYYQSFILHRTYWLGVLTSKQPSDLWAYQEILYETRPDLIVEAGTYEGGSALYLATVCDALGSGRVLTVDIEPRPGRPAHPRITYLLGSSTAASTIQAVREVRAERVMVILDSDHSRAHVARELELYAPLVTPDCYLIVEDTNPQAAGMFPRGTVGTPAEALTDFLSRHGEFEVDASREKFLATGNPGGYLRRVK